jgi:hypothetical protein
MFVGHFALGFAAKRVTPRVSLVVLFAAAQLADLLWPFFRALGLEAVRINPGNPPFTQLDFVSYPYSHSLLFLVIWGVAFGWLYRMATGEGRAFLVLAALVISHWVLDFVTHVPDMPLYPGGPKLGLGLWNFVPATMAIELTIRGGSLGLWCAATRPDKTGYWAFLSFAVFLTVAYFASAFGGAPPSVVVRTSARLWRPYFDALGLVGRSPSPGGARLSCVGPVVASRPA